MEQTDPNSSLEIRVTGRSKHPWFLWKEVAKPENRIPPGTIVEALDSAGVWVGRGFYNGHARIRLRVLTRRRDEPVDRQFFEKRLQRAIEWRFQHLKLGLKTNAFRLVNSEGDDLSGLVVDRYDDLLVIEYFSAGMFRVRNIIREALTTSFPGSRLYEFAETHIQKQESFDCRTGDAPKATEIQEGGVRFEVAPGTRHKTGFFLDQRENRFALSLWTEGKSVLDLCCHSGGFGIHALKRGKAQSVLGVDRDENALELAKKNAKLNEVSAEWRASDILELVPELVRNRNLFDVVVLDPPRQTRSNEGLPPALKRYFEMNRAAMSAVKPGGVFLSCSCTGLVKEHSFLEVIREAAQASRRQVQIFELTGAGPDHPFMAQVPEGRYLKAAWCRLF